MMIYTWFSITVKKKIIKTFKEKQTGINLQVGNFTMMH